MLLPEGSLLTVTDNLTLTGIVAVKAIKYRALTIPFVRSEFMGEKLRGAKNIDGSVAVFTVGAGGSVSQYFGNCNPNETIRPTDPDDSRIDMIYQRFNVLRLEVEGANTPPDQVDAIFDIRRNHAARLSRFDAHFEVVRGDVSFTFLTNTAQVEDFDFITDTNVSISGFSLGALGTLDDCVIVEFSPDVTREIPQDAAYTTTKLKKEWSMVIEKRTIVPHRSSVFNV